MDALMEQMKKTSVQLLEMKQEIEKKDAELKKHKEMALQPIPIVYKCPHYISHQELLDCIVAKKLWKLTRLVIYEVPDLYGDEFDEMILLILKDFRERNYGVVELDYWTNFIDLKETEKTEEDYDDIWLRAFCAVARDNSHNELFDRSVCYYTKFKVGKSKEELGWKWCPSLNLMVKSNSRRELVYDLLNVARTNSFCVEIEIEYTKKPFTFNYVN